MKLNEILNNSNHLTEDELKIKIGCSEFLEHSKGSPIFRTLKPGLPDFTKVKIRKKKETSTYSTIFNETFEIKDLYQRALFTKSIPLRESIDKDIYYIFPKNGYKFMFSEGIIDSTREYKSTFIELKENLGDNSIITFAELLKYSYKNENLSEGIENGAEIIFYNIPSYYAIRSSSINYGNIYSKLL